MGSDYIKLQCFLTKRVILQNSNVFCQNSLTFSSLSLKFFGASPQGGASLQAILLPGLDDALVFGKHFIMKCHSCSSLNRVHIEPLDLGVMYPIYNCNSRIWMSL